MHFVTEYCRDHRARRMTYRTSASGLFEIFIFPSVQSGVAVIDASFAFNVVEIWINFSKFCSQHLWFLHSNIFLGFVKFTQFLTFVEQEYSRLFSVELYFPLEWNTLRFIEIIRKQIRTSAK